MEDTLQTHNPAQEALPRRQGRRTPDPALFDALGARARDRLVTLAAPGEKPIDLGELRALSVGYWRDGKDPAGEGGPDGPEPELHFVVHVVVDVDNMDEAKDVGYDLALRVSSHPKVVQHGVAVSQGAEPVWRSVYCGRRLHGLRTSCKRRVLHTGNCSPDEDASTEESVS